MKRKKILVIDDTRLMIKMITDILEEAGYEVISAASGTEGLLKVKKEKPDLVILDVVMPDMSGFDVCKYLRRDIKNDLIPIIILTSRSDEGDILKGLELGADDYIVKPFNPRELVSRVRNTLMRLDRSRWVNPLTGLVGNNEIQVEMQNRIDNNSLFAVMYTDLDNFKAYNDVYGFICGDECIKLTADILVHNVELFGTDDDFVGHIGGDDFVIITVPESAVKIAEGIICDFDRQIVKMYNEQDLKKGYIIAVDRSGNENKVPILTVSIAIVTNEERKLYSPAQIAEIAAEVKKKAKRIKGSAWVKG